MAPELMYKLPYDAKKADVFAMGVILFVFFSGHPPFHEATEHDPYYKLFIKNPKGFWDFHAKQNLKRNYSENFRSLISKMIELKASARLSIDDIKQSPWFNEPVDEQLAAQTIHAYMQKMASVIQANKTKQTNTNQTFRSGTSQDKLNFLASLSENLKSVTLESLPSNSLGKRCDLVVRLAEKDDLLRLVVNMAKHSGAEIVLDQSSRLKLKFPAQGLSRVAVLELSLYSLGDESLYGLDIFNFDADYFDFMAHKAKFIQELHAHCPKA
jgi:serine/threonine protein kinase